MSDKDTKQDKSAKKAFSPGKAKKSGGKPCLFEEDELDIYCDKITKEAYIFHSKIIDYKTLERMEYDPEDYSVAVYLKDGAVLDLGVRIQWLIRPYFSKATEVQIIRTENKEPVDGTFIPITHKK